MSLILAVESSCDESAVAVYDTEKGALSNQVYSQILLHRSHGGVVPELAARDHIRRLPLLLKQALNEAETALTDISFFAYTAGPGLLGALMTGAAFSRALAYAQGKPALAIHHMEGHLLSPMLNTPKPDYPFIALLVSGGHTQLVAVETPENYRLLGQTIDDAVGEAFDKTAKLMGLPYPGGPELAALAEKGDATRYQLSKPMINRPGMDMSFSGLKTQVRLLIEDKAAAHYPDIAACFEQTVAETLAIKCRRAWEATGYRDLVVAGGVSANRTLRDKLESTANKLGKNVFFPPLALCGDNALMIAYAAAQRLAQAEQDNLSIDVKARWPLEEISL